MSLLSQRSRSVLVLVLLSWLVPLDLLLAPARAVALEPEDYQPRGNRSEGVRPKPVSGYDLELLSVLAQGPATKAATADGLPNILHLRFYLPEPVPVHLTVREQRYRHYYWLDHVLPSPPWQAGFNEFSWPTGEVLRRIDPQFPLENLAVLVRLNRDHPASIESIAPAILYHERFPSEIASYVVTMKPAADSRIKCEVFAEGAETALWTRHIPLAAGDQPVSVRWETEGAQAGPYRMVITGYFLDSNERFTQTIRMYHQPRVR